MKILDIGYKYHMECGHVFKPWKPEVINPELIAEIDLHLATTDLVIFGGGADIHPSLYGHDNIATGAGNVPSARDLFEKEVWKRAISSKVPILGICRGAQLACALSGGFLIQDVMNHNLGTHKITTDDGQELDMSSVHHQMMFPNKTNHKLLAWSSKQLSEGYYTYDYFKIKTLNLDKEPEAVFFTDTNAIGVQGHPEFYNDPFMPAVVYTRAIVNKYLFDGRYPNV
jgi:gamma-glutamyl-gamma-aminobutyrate hydrolase PuuD